MSELVVRSSIITARRRRQLSLAAACAAHCCTRHRLDLCAARFCSAHKSVWRSFELSWQPYFTSQNQRADCPRQLA